MYEAYYSDGEIEALIRNDKLEELIRDMWLGMCGYDHNCCLCGHFDGEKDECEFRTHIRELGIRFD